MSLSWPEIAEQMLRGDLARYDKAYLKSALVGLKATKGIVPQQAADRIEKHLKGRR